MAGVSAPDYLRWRIFERMRRFLRPNFRLPLPVFFVPTQLSVDRIRLVHRPESAKKGAGQTFLILACARACKQYGPGRRTAWIDVLGPGVWAETLRFLSKLHARIRKRTECDWIANGKYFRAATATRRDCRPPGNPRHPAIAAKNWAARCSNQASVRRCIRFLIRRILARPKCRSVRPRECP
jgi:hypothetical protein